VRRAQEALRSVAGRALEDKQRSLLAQLEGTNATTTAAAAAATTTTGQRPATAVPIMKSMDPPPPSFESMKFPPPMEMQRQIIRPALGGASPSDAMVGHGMNSRALTQPPPPPPPPPSFDFLERQMNDYDNGVVAVQPSAPPVSPAEEKEEEEEECRDHPTDLLGLMPVAAPAMPRMHQRAPIDVPPPPPSFAEFESSAAEQEVEEESTIFDYDDAGNPLSPGQRRALLDEQRLLYEQIMSEKVANDEAIARVRAEAFDMRSSASAVRAMPGGGSGADSPSPLVARDRAMDSAGRDIAASDAAEADSAGEAGAPSSAGRMVKIGNNQMVALHGQDRTRRAIKEGTAILVQCINCQNWMQVTDSATLMFCPVCQVVSPVIKQNEVLTKEEAMQLTMDRKLAEKLQAEYNSQGIEDEAEEEGGGKSSADDEGFLSRLFGSGASKYPAARSGVEALSKSAPAAQSEVSDSWWDKISSIVSYGVADEGAKERGELGVTRPPGTASQQRRGTAPAATSSVAVHDRAAASTTETRGLLSPVVVDGNEANLPAARVADQRPLFSCVMDSVSSATSALWSSTGERDGEGNCYGVDASSLLVTNAGRGVGDGAGDYAQLPDRE
jgi:hypothetical protein